MVASFAPSKYKTSTVEGFLHCLEFWYCCCCILLWCLARDPRLFQDVVQWRLVPTVHPWGHLNYYSTSGGGGGTTTTSIKNKSGRTPEEQQAFEREIQWRVNLALKHQRTAKKSREGPLIPSSMAEAFVGAALVDKTMFLDRFDTGIASV
jgi:hypothetical protein